MKRAEDLTNKKELLKRELKRREVKKSYGERRRKKWENLIPP